MPFPLSGLYYSFGMAAGEAGKFAPEMLILQRLLDKPEDELKKTLARISMHRRGPGRSLAARMARPAFVKAVGFLALHHEDDFVRYCASYFVKLAVQEQPKVARTLFPLILAAHDHQAHEKPLRALNLLGFALFTPATLEDDLFREKALDVLSDPLKSADPLLRHDSLLCLNRLVECRASATAEQIAALPSDDRLPERPFYVGVEPRCRNHVILVSEHADNSFLRIGSKITKTQGFILASALRTEVTKYAVKAANIALTDDDAQVRRTARDVLNSVVRTIHPELNVVIRQLALGSLGLGRERRAAARELLATLPKEPRPGLLPPFRLQTRDL